METWQFLAHGIVQGVGFRWSVQLLAQKLGLPGTVRNNPDGTVTIVLQGEPETLRKFKEELPSASQFAKISRLDVKVLPKWKNAFFSCIILSVS